jgi:hypothetical protein
MNLKITHLFSWISTANCPIPALHSSGRDSSEKPTGMRRNGADRGLAANSPAFSPFTKVYLNHQNQMAKRARQIKKSTLLDY